MTWQISRRNLFRASAAMAGAGVLQACPGGARAAQPSVAANPKPPAAPVRRTDGNVLRIVATSGFAPDPARARSPR